MEKSRLYAEVIITSATSPNNTYTYYIPDTLKNEVNIGSLVSVEFGRKILSAFVSNITDSVSADYPIKPILDTLDKYTSKQLLPARTVSFLKKLSEHYITDIGSYIPYCIPDSLITNFSRYVKLVDDWEARLPQILSKSGKGLIEMLKSESMLYDTLTPTQKKSAREFIGIGVLADDFKLVLPQDKYNYEKIVHINGNADLSGLTKRQKEIVQVLSEYPDGIRLNELIEIASTTPATINKLVEKHILSVSHLKLHRDTYKNYLQNIEKKEVAVAELTIPAKENLIIGGSVDEKIALHIKIIEETIENGSVLYLVPDRTLIGYVLSSIAARFELSQIAILHGEQNESEHYEQWLRIYNNEAKIIISTKQGIFAPIEDLKAVIIMDEHDGSYSENYYPYYDTIKAVQLKSQDDDIRIYYTSDTPSIEIRHRCDNSIISLPKQHYHIEIIDMRQELKNGNAAPVSVRLRQEMDEHKQAILLWLRRGYANVVQCRMCGYIDNCPHCHIPMAYHRTKSSHIMVCHNCQLKKQVLTECPECHSNKIKFLSGGTQKVEEYLQKAFSNKNIVRVDSDTITRKDQLAVTQKEYLSGNIDMVVGTQMVSRGFYNTDSCVGLILADVLLHIPSYNASHRFYSIVMQLAAQSHKHHLILQTYTPDIPVMRYIADNDYESFYANELHNREEYGYPPFSKLYKIEIFHKDESKLNKIADTIYADLKSNLSDKAIVNKPNVPYIPKRGDKYIREIQIKSHKEVHDIISNYYRNKAKELRNIERDCYINIIVDSED